jgi:hypothetical protein
VSLIGFCFLRFDNVAMADRRLPMSGQRIGDWFLWQPAQRAHLVNRVSRQIMENPKLADLYWRQRQQRAVVTARIAKRALADPRFAKWYWDRRDRQAREMAGGGDRQAKRDGDVKRDSDVQRERRRAARERVPVVRWIDLRDDKDAKVKSGR